MVLVTYFKNTVGLGSQIFFVVVQSGNKKKYHVIYTILLVWKHSQSSHLTEILSLCTHP